MILAVRGVSLALAITLGVVSGVNSTPARKATPPAPKYITVIRYDQVPTTEAPTTTTTVPVAPVRHHAIVPRVVQHTGYDAGTPLWDTWTWDKTAYEPSATDPTRKLPLSVQRVFACIRYTESRNHPNDTNQQSGAEGLYQFLPYIWQYGEHALGIAVDNANYATPEQQSAVAVWYYERNGGFSPEWQDGCTP